ncbi:MAG: methyltransferase domain-containing protein [Sulfurimonas sp.]|nr:methyltransferase domain-containing protein [Sulfurimonas sp.]
MLKFTTQNMLEIITILEEKLNSLNSKEIIEFEVLNPDIQNSIYAGNLVKIENVKYIYRGYKSWCDLAEILKCKILTPITRNPHAIIIRYERLNEDISFHKNSDTKEFKYGTDSIFSKIYKNEEPAFLHYYKQALKNVNINKRVRILNLGVNSGDEFELIQQYSSNFDNLELVGIDYCESAIEEAKSKFLACGNTSFYTHDINDLASLDLGKFDLIISIGTLQSSNLEFNPLFMSIVQNQLKKDGAMILGFPNCRWLDGEMIYGARVKNYPFSEMGLLYKDVIFCKKYLQQKKFRVTITGKDYIFLTATSIIKN